MVKIAIVEDEEKMASLLKQYIVRYGTEHNEKFNIQWFTNGLEFIDSYKADCDVVFMDIQMPEMNGLDAAFKLRELDSNVIIIFVTNMAQYAINGYKVGALDFMIKPIEYFDFLLKLERALLLAKTKAEVINVTLPDGIFCVKLSDIMYVNSEGHYLFIHKSDGKVIKKRLTMGEIEKAINNSHFSKANHSYFVNLSYITKVTKSEIYLDKEIITISRSHKNSFMKKFTSFMGRSVL